MTWPYDEYLQHMIYSVELLAEKIQWDCSCLCRHTAVLDILFYCKHVHMLNGYWSTYVLKNAAIA